MTPDERAKPADMQWADNTSKNDYQQFGVPTNSGGSQLLGAGGFTGQLVMWPNKTAPDGWLVCDGQSYEAADYPDLFNVLCPLLGTFTVVSATDVFTCVAHGLRDGDQIALESDDTLPAPLDDSGTYNYPAILYIRDATTDTFKVALTEGGSAINITDTGTGVHTLRHTPYGLIGTGLKQNDPLQFYVPFMVSNTPFGYDPGGDYNTYPFGKFDQAPDHAHTLSDAGIAKVMVAVVSNHGVQIDRVNPSVGTWDPSIRAGTETGASSGLGADNQSGAGLMGSTDSHNSSGTPTSPYIIVNFIIKT